MRGKAFSKANGNADLGITPAYAGKRWFRFLSSFALGDHPRLCGEKSTGVDVSSLSLGITPAYAGKRE